MSKRGLGKGLDALLSTSSLAREKQQKVDHSQALSSEGQLAKIAISQLSSGKYQPRKDIQPEALEELSCSIRSQGIIQPIVVRQISEEKFEIIAGERRWRAAKLAGLTQVPCVIKNVQDRAAIAMALIENIQRENLNVIEEAQALERLQQEFELTHQQVADVIGKSRTAVTNLIRLNTLDDEVKHCVVSRKLEMGHARALLSLELCDQSNVAKIVVAKKLTVRQTEALVKKHLEPKTAKTPSDDLYAQQFAEQLSAQFGHKVEISRNAKGKGKLTISFDDMEQVVKILNTKSEIN
ncbi:ParB/RepB/Spo0J family partition protein [Vibrio sp. S11_S32]|uniref:ParB/RepB/Spo0J family partition protein n=1 Tax=Vibrio sp. S11_S32 TaxID=2720225 RepID=UPI001681190C|nr:ParB/RepB/Spo0J family partition protein [Vibrio sp. S11_S32]MBD1576402.1 ParB/RepB/Spo0J family partition protein [Vibrio sp. S11_S32]